MQKIYFSLLVALGLSACANKTTESTTTTDTPIVEQQEKAEAQATANEVKAEPSINWQDSSYVAVAYLGYDKNINAIKESDLFKKLSESLPQLNAIERIAVDAQGDELYLIVPRDKEANVVVYEYTFEMATKEKPEKSGMVYYKSENGNPFIVKGNISDICPNMQIELTCKNGESYTFSPSLSLENGKLSVNKGMQSLE